MTDKKEVCNHTHNDIIFENIAGLEREIEKLKSDLKPLTLKENTSLAACNAIAAKHRAEKDKPEKPKASKAK